MTRGVDGMPGDACEPSARIRRVALSSGDLDVLETTHLKDAYPPHFHAMLAIGVIDSGSLHVRYHHRRVIATPGTIGIIRAGVVHTGEPQADLGCSYRMFYVRPDVVSAALDRAQGSDDIDFADVLVDDPGLAHWLTEVHRLLLESHECDLEREEAVLMVLRALIERHASHAIRADNAAHGSPEFARARDYLEAHYARQVALGELSAVCGLSQFQLIRLFNKSVGIPPHAYLKQVRINRARALLQNGISVSMAALRSGFSDQAHLTRTFKQMVGVPPGAYAAAAHTAVYRTG